MSAPGLSPRERWQLAICGSSELRPSHRHVAMVLALYLNFQMVGGLSVVKIAAATGCDLKTITAALKALRDGGWITVQLVHGRGRTTVYRAEVPALFRSDETPETVGVRRDETPETVGVRRDETPETVGVRRDETPETVGVHRDETPETVALFTRRTTTYVRPDGSGGLFMAAVPSAREQLAQVDVDEDVVDQVLEDLRATTLRPRSGNHVRRLRGLIRERLLAGVTRAEILEDAGSAPSYAHDPASVFATVVRRQSEVAPPVAQRPAWCGQCDERTRLLELDDGSAGRCPTCHPLSFAAAMAR
jgi:hypothetical protein